ncbi:hypothetical protein [Kitasatospora sp. NPDC087315]|uniref:hypothetical protein n=1 Tax=Kitasatospora sp. NPDC087315 TaxID=3364069 RepID=UPI003813F515
MKALTYHGPGRRTWGDVPDPVVRDPIEAVGVPASFELCTRAYDIFADADTDGALKVALFRT